MDDGRNSTGRDATEGSKHELDVPTIPPGELQYLQDQNHQTQENLKMQSHTDLSSLFDTYKSSVLNKDGDALMSIYGHDFVAFDMWGAWCLVGDGPWREVIQKWLGSLGSGTVVIEFDDINIIPGDDVSAAHATVTYRGLSDTGEILRSMQNRLTWIAKRTDGIWKIVHQHTSAPIEPGTMIARLHR
jgi:ketosteroid isomerase-like protein